MVSIPSLGQLRRDRPSFIPHLLIYDGCPILQWLAVFASLERGLRQIRVDHPRGMQSSSLKKRLDRTADLLRTGERIDKPLNLKPASHPCTGRSKWTGSKTIAAVQRDHFYSGPLVGIQQFAFPNSTKEKAKTKHSQTLDLI
jgi:hypothetical protein